MRELEKITVEGVRYLVWDEALGISPRQSGIALLLSDSDGVGADALLVLPKHRPLALRAYGKDGGLMEVDENAHRAASLAMETFAMLAAGENIVADGGIDRAEVRLTDSFCTRLFSTEKRARIAG